MTACVCYVTDRGYLFPTFVSAVQARLHSSPSKADVLIIGIGLDSAAEACFMPACNTEGIKLISLPLEAIDGLPAMMARLFLTRLLPEKYNTFLYLDGDIQIRGSLDQLIDTEISAGTFFAADDPLQFSLLKDDAHTQMVMQHFVLLGIKHSYFNYGVLWVDREGWNLVEDDARTLFRESAQSRFPDQDILNIVAGKKRVPLSLKWNFPVFMRNARVESLIKPHVYHFMANPKPWTGAFSPWGFEGNSPYLELIKQYPKMRSYKSEISYKAVLRYHLQQRYKQVIESIVWGLSQRRNNIIEYEQNAT